MHTETSNGVEHMVDERGRCVTRGRDHRACAGDVVTTWPYHYRDDGTWCRWSGVTHRTPGQCCHSGCDGSRHHYANDGHPECDEVDVPTERTT